MVSRYITRSEISQSGDAEWTRRETSRLTPRASPSLSLRGAPMRASIDHDPKEDTRMRTPPIVSPEEWNVAREELLDKEKQFTRGRDELAAQRRRMPWMEV